MRRKLQCSGRSIGRNVRRPDITKDTRNGSNLVQVKPQPNLHRRPRIPSIRIKLIVQEHSGRRGDRCTEAAVAAAMEGPYMRLAIGVSTERFQKNSDFDTFFAGTRAPQSKHAKRRLMP